MHSLYSEKYSGLFGELKVWRENFPSTVSSYNGILPFVIGLRFSVRLMYILKKILLNSSLDAAWGHILEKDNSYAIYYSNECDIIIYKRMPDTIPSIWNGDTTQDVKAMDFRFINKKAVVGVISCKSTIRKSDIDPVYPTQLKKFTKNVWLFSECCGHFSYSKIKKEAKKFGYKDYWSLYDWSPSRGAKENRKSWQEFDEYFTKLARKYP